MKKIYTIITAILLTATLWAQSPEKMSYQAVIRNSSDELLTNQTVGMQISILQGTADGTPVYIETQTPTTNANGLVSLEIGGDNATVVLGDFTIINWANSTYFIKTETDPTGSTSYTITGTNQLLSVPYALHAKTADNFTGEITITETDPIFTAWDKTTGISITESQVSDLNHFTNSDESDPVYSQSVASGITATDTSNWNSGQGSFTETDPVYLSSQASGITSTDITNLGNLSGVNTGDQDILAMTHTNRTALDAVSGVNTGDQDLSGKVNVVTGKDLSTNDYTDIDKTKLSGIATGAEINVNVDWNSTSGDSQILNKPTIITTAQASDIETNNAKVTYPSVDATKLSGIETGAEVNVNSDWNSTSGDSQILNKPDLSTYAAQSNVLQLDNTTAFIPDADYEPATKKYVDDNTGSSITYSVGDFAKGGIVFWVDETGQHGLVCAKNKRYTGGVKWNNGSNASTGALGDGLYAGSYNTPIIVAFLKANSDDGTGDASLSCVDYSVEEGGVLYGDWYLPSKYELNMIYEKIDIINTTAIANGGSSLSGGYIWSSTEVYSTPTSSLKACSQSFNVGSGTGDQMEEFKYNTRYVIPVRRF